MILLRPEVLSKLDGTVEGVREALQQAIKLEHSTIPPYLYALYSLRPGCNEMTGAIITSVVMEEMLHMSLACNVLNAVGGSPLIDTPDFIPSYPGPLPGGVEAGLTVGLAPCSICLVDETFMEIERPENPLDLPVLPTDAMLAAPPAEPITIGTFYRSIIAQIVNLGDGIFTGDPALQLTTSFTDIPLFPVTDVATAQKALTTIIDQGEGTATSPMDEGQAPAHYYRFAQIVEGRLIVAAPDLDPPYAYGGDPVDFDPAGVWPVVSNPVAAAYPPGSPAAIANQQFNGVYTQVLKALHAAFNGAPDAIANAVLNMLALKQMAGHLMTIPVADGYTAGPSFEYQP